jgi:hypothetical protein
MKGVTAAMWVVAAIVGVGALIALAEAPYLIRKKMTKELYVFAGLLLVGEALSIMQVLRIPIPNPVHYITVIYKPISDFVLRILE